MFSKRVNQEWVVLVFLIAIFITIRTVNFSFHLNFSSDQASSSSRALELFRNREITLIGPPTSINIDGRQIFYGSATYYFQLLFLILGNFDPVVSSYLFMLFSSIMIIPLYFGMEKITNRNTALLTVVIYSLFPFYINYTRFLWNPNYQFSLLPILIFLTGVQTTAKGGRKLNTLLLGFWTGLLVLFHYQFLIIMMFLLIYLIIKHIPWRRIAILVTGIILGLSPLIIFEIRNNFYNIRTIIYFIRYKNSLASSLLSITTPHYFLSLSFIALVIILYILKDKINQRVINIIFISLLLVSLFKYFSKPSHGFGMVKNWNYLDEAKGNKYS